jgi:stage III sporulation protein AH
MNMGKRQLVLSALIVALGAAVYLNWEFMDHDSLMATDAVVSNSSHELGEAQLANVPVSGSSNSNSSAQSGNKTGTMSSDYFSEARLSRQKSRDQAVELLEKTITDTKSNEAAKKDAVAKAAVISQNTIQESNIENLIKAKGFPDCVVFIQNSECSVVVKMKDSSQNNATVIKDIVEGQSGIKCDKIKIVEVK